MKNNIQQCCMLYNGFLSRSEINLKIFIRAERVLSFCRFPVSEMWKIWNQSIESFPQMLKCTIDWITTSVEIRVHLLSVFYFDAIWIYLNLYVALKIFPHQDSLIVRYYLYCLRHFNIRVKWTKNIDYSMNFLYLFYYYFLISWKWWRWQRKLDESFIHHSWCIDVLLFYHITYKIVFSSHFICVLSMCNSNQICVVFDEIP